MKLYPNFLRLKKREYPLVQKKRVIEVQRNAVYEKLVYFKETKEEVSHV